MNLYEIAKKIDNGDSVIKYRNELSMCPFLRYSSDEDLVIAKVDLPDDSILDILENIAHEEDLELKIQTRNE